MQKIGYGVEKLLAPKSVAVIGVSGDTSKASTTGATGVLANLIKYGYKGNIYPINPKYDNVLGLKSYPSITSLPETVDLLVIGVKSELVLPILKQAANIGVGSSIIITSGFGEDKRAEHKQMQQEMTQLSIESGMRICGPNCLGMINVHQNTVAISSVGLGAGPVNPGGVALISQSGALVSSMLAKGKDKGIGFSYIVSSGNEADLELADYIHILADDPNTKAIAAYIEGIKNADKFSEAASLCWEKNKPLIVLKVGRSEKGARAAQAHTGSITGSDEIINAIFEKYNVIRVYSLDDLLEISQAFSHKSAVKTGRRVGVITVSGGTGSILSDICEDLNLEISELEPQTISCLEGFLPAYTSIKNPIDVTAGILREPENLIKTAQAVEADPNVDALCISLTAATHEFETKIADYISKFNEQCKKMLVTSWYSGSMNQEGMKTLQKRGVPCFSSHEAVLSFIKSSAIRNSKDYNNLKTFQKLKKTEIQIPEIVRMQSGVLSEFDSKKVLREFGIPTVQEENIQNLSDAKNFAQSVGYPVVLKINSPDIPHKSEAGCVAIDIKSVEELETAYNAVMKNALAFKKDADIQGLLIQEMINHAQECIIGVKFDRIFGPVVMFGLGGIFVEVLKDVTFNMAPITEEDARAMVTKIKGHRMLQGYRGRPKADVDSLVEVLQKVGLLAWTLRDELAELDINPLMVLESGKGVKVADALVVLNH